MRYFKLFIMKRALRITYHAGFVLLGIDQFLRMCNIKALTQGSTQSLIPMLFSKGLNS